MLLGAAALAIGAYVSGCAHYEVVGYYAGWKPETAIAPGELTVVNYAFAYVAPDGALVLDGGEKEAATLARLVALKDRDPALRVMISVGGWTRSNRFSDMATDAAMRARFIETTIAWLRSHRFDGVDIDWEYPGDIGAGCPAGETCQRPEDKRNFVMLARELRAALDAAGRKDGKHYLATIAAGADEKYLLDGDDHGAWLRELAASLDWINLMSYDYHGSWERVAGLNAPLYRDPRDPIGTSVDGSVRRLLQAGIPARKIVLGVPFYGKGWSGCEPGPAGDGLYQPCGGLASGSADESFDFAYLVDEGYLDPHRFARHWNDAARVPWLYEPSSGIFITYDDEASIRDKTRYVVDQGLAGAMFWEIGADRHGVLRKIVSEALR